MRPAPPHQLHHQLYHVNILSRGCRSSLACSVRQVAPSASWAAVSHERLTRHVNQGQIWHHRRVHCELYGLRCHCSALSFEVAICLGFNLISDCLCNMKPMHLVARCRLIRCSFMHAKLHSRACGLCAEILTDSSSQTAPYQSWSSSADCYGGTLHTPVHWGLQAGQAAEGVASL